MKTDNGNTIHCRRCARIIFISTGINYLWMESTFAPCDDDNYQSGQITLCSKCTKKIRELWLSTPVPRPQGWWKKIVDPNLKGWAKLKKRILAPVMDTGPCDRCRQEKKLYQIKFPSQHSFGKDDVRYFCEECMNNFSEEFKA